jgi:hypothetical protein
LSFLLLFFPRLAPMPIDDFRHNHETTTLTVTATRCGLRASIKFHLWDAQQ